MNLVVGFKEELWSCEDVDSSRKTLPVEAADKLTADTAAKEGSRN